MRRVNDRPIPHRIFIVRLNSTEWPSSLIRMRYLGIQGVIYQLLKGTEGLEAKPSLSIKMFCEIFVFTLFI